MTAATLRKAARLMRERAENANEGPWYSEVNLHDPHATLMAAPPGGEPYSLTSDLVRPDARHIASWHPDVAIAVADLLDIVEAGWVEYDPDGPGTESMHFVCAWADNLARAYIGSTS